MIEHHVPAVMGLAQAADLCWNQGSSYLVMSPWSMLRHNQGSGLSRDWMPAVDPTNGAEVGTSLEIPMGSHNPPQDISTEKGSHTLISSEILPVLTLTSSI